jgi:predicted amino acid dehydrogenase
LLQIIREKLIHSSLQPACRSCQDSYLYSTRYEFAFIVHPRSRHDVTRKYPFFRYVPDGFANLVTKYFWPVTLSRITGLKSQINGKEINGHLITVLITARQMVEDRPLALKRIIQACALARKKGAKIVGLGGLTSSFSRGGLDLINKVGINITTGHAYASYNVTQNVFALVRYMNLDKKKSWIAIVGAAGSMGATTAKLLAREGFVKLLLIDLERKHHHFPELIEEIKKLNLQATVEMSHQICDIKKCDIIVAATNAPEALIRSADLKSGAIVVDDAQPSDVDPDVLERKDVLVIEAGVTHTPNLNNNFNFGLKNRQDNFCCLAEVFILAANEWDKHYVINRATLELVDEIANLGKKLNFTIGSFQNFKESISDEKLSYVKSIINHVENGKNVARERK